MNVHDFPPMNPDSPSSGPYAEMETKLAWLLSANQKLTQSNRFFSLVLEAMPHSLIVTDRNQRVGKTNQRFESLFQLTTAEVVGRPLRTLFEGLRNRFRDTRLLFALLDRCQEDPLWSGSVETELADERGTRLSVSLVAVKDGEGVQGYLLLFIDITERHRAEGGLREKNQELESLVYTVSHDLKNPISVIMGVTELIESQLRPHLDADGDEFIRMLKEEAGKMLRMIEDILQVSRVQRGKIEKELVNTLSVLNDIVAEFQHVYRDISTIFIIQESLPTVMAQPTMLVQIFKNLIINAIKYGDSEKPMAMVEIGYRDKPDFHHFYVKDNGMGMAPEEAAQVFDMFYRVGDKSIEGTGLGTYIVRKLVEGHGGKVWVESAKGVGSTFTFTLPRHPDDIPAATQPQSTLTEFSPE